MADMSKRSPLAVLVDEVCLANGWSRREVARRAQAKGHDLSPSRLGQLLNEYPLPGIQSDKIEAIAAGLAIPEERVARAASAAMGFRIDADGGALTPAEAIRRDPSLSVDTKAALLAVLQSRPDPESEVRRKA